MAYRNVYYYYYYYYFEKAGSVHVYISEHSRHCRANVKQRGRILAIIIQLPGYWRCWKWNSAAGLQAVTVVGYTHGHGHLLTHRD